MSAKSCAVGRLTLPNGKAGGSRLAALLAGSLLFQAFCGSDSLAQPSGLLFVEQTNSFPPVRAGSLAWMDFDNDGDYDLLLSGDMGSPTGGTSVARLYLNSTGVFTDAGFSLPLSGVADVADFNNDGFVDLALTGFPADGPVKTRVYRNLGGTNLAVLATIADVYAHVASGDFNRDGWLDLAVSGDSFDASPEFSRVFTNQHGSGFAPALVIFPEFYGWGMEWADFDRDGDLDLCVAGSLGDARDGAYLYRNDDGTFNAVGNILLASSVSGQWFDSDNDGWPDLLITAHSKGASFVFRNNQAGWFTNVASLPMLGHVTVGDCNNDGFSDAVVTGYRHSDAGFTFGRTSLCLNSSTGRWTELTNVFAQLDSSAAAWGDYDRDGRLDLIQIGQIHGSGIYGTHLYRNLTARTNTPPLPPSALTATFAGAEVLLLWNEASDPDQRGGLTYNVRVGSVPGGGDVVSPMSAPDGFRRVIKRGNAESKTRFALRGLQPGRTYYWSVQTVDNGFAGSTFAPERRFEFQFVQAPEITLHPKDQSVAYGQPVSFVVGFAGERPAQYQWRFNGNAIPAATNDSYTLDHVLYGDAGKYSVLVANDSGSATSSNALLTVFAPTNCGPVPVGLLSWWKWEADTFDSAGTNEGSIFGRSNFVSGVVGLAFGPDGSNSFFTASPAMLPMGDSPRSLEFWARVDEYAVPDAFFVGYGLNGDSPTPPLSLACNLVTRNRRLAFTNESVSLLGPEIQPGAWHHLAMTYASNHLALYLDGELVAATNTAFLTTAAVPLYVGGTPTNLLDPSQFFLKGAVDELAVYDRALDALEIASVFMAGRFGKCPLPRPGSPVIVKQPASQIAHLDHDTGFSVEAGGSRPLAYQWLFNGTPIPNGTNAALILSFVQLEQTGVYAVVVSNRFGSTTSDNAALTVLGFPPAIFSSPQDRTVAAGSNVILTVLAAGTPPLAYQWVHDSNAVASATGSSLSFNNVQPALAGSYFAVVSNAWGAVTSSTATLTVLTFAPSISTHPQSQVRYEGKSANFSLNASGTQPLSYQWCFNGDALQGQTTSTLSLTNIQFSQAGSYWAVVSNAYGWATSSAAQLTVLPPPVCAPVPAGAVAWWRAESNTVDSVGINDVFSAETRFPTSSYTTGKVGAAFRFVASFFGGPNNYLSVPPSADLNLGAGDGLTVEGWIRPTLPAMGSSVQPLIEWNDNRGNIGAGLALNGSVLEAHLTDTNATPIRRIVLRSPAGIVVTSVWHHVALTFDKATGLLTTYVSGVSVAQTNLGAFLPQTLAAVYLAYRPSGTNSGSSYRGDMDEMTLYNRALTATEIQAIATADEAGKCLLPPPPCVPPPSDFLAWWRGESNVLDSVDANHGIVTNSVSYIAGVVGKALQFNTGFVRIPASSSLNVGAAPGLTIESWISPQFSSSRLVVPTTRQFVGWHSGIVTQGVSLSLIRPPPLSSSLAWEANLVDTENHPHVLRTPTGLATLGVWQHVALTYDKASGTAVLYFNGAPVTQTNLGNFTPKTTADLRLGYQTPIDPIPGASAGAMDELSIYSRALSAVEMRAIMLSRSTGKCMQPPTIVIQPATLRINEGGNAVFTAVAAGNPILRYQWRWTGTNVPGATVASLLLTNVQLAQSGFYSLRVTNAFGAAVSSNAMLRVNRPPVADASATIPLVIVPVNCSPTLVLNGSRSSDPDADPLQYNWLRTGDNEAFATGVVALVHLPLGNHSITLVVDDGLATRSHSFAMEVISPAQAIERLLALVNSQAPNAHPLAATLEAARASIERRQVTAAINQLEAFQNKVRAQVGPLRPERAGQFILASQDVIHALNQDCASARPRGKIGKVSRPGNGRVRMEFSAPHGRTYLIEASTNLVDWEKIGVATACGPDEFEFEDANVARMPTRFYRIMIP